jgi:hypothetical protein
MRRCRPSGLLGSATLTAPFPGAGTVVCSCPMGVSAAADARIAEVEQLVQLLEGGRTDPRHLVECLKVDLTLAAQLEDLVRKLGTEPGLDQLLAAGGMHIRFGHPKLRENE